MPEPSKGRPWWLAALIGGATAGGVVVSALDGGRHEAAAAPSQHTAAAAAAVDETARWRERMEAKMDVLTEKVARIEGRLGSP